MRVADLLTKITRRINLARKRSKKLRHWAPLPVVYWYSRTSSYLTEFRSWHTRVEQQSPLANIYHCCVVKTGSQWVRGLLRDLATFRYTGLSNYHYQSRTFRGRDPRRKQTDRYFSEPFPTGAVVTPLYIGYNNFEALPKPERYKAFMMIRDPRDILVSWYFSTRYSHIIINDHLGGARSNLNELSIPEGLRYSIHWLESEGVFEALDGWRDAPEKDPNVCIVRYEELAGENGFEAFRELFEFLEIGMPNATLRELLDAYSFKKVTGGRKPGEENVHSHIRKGIAGDWKNHFDEETQRVFDEVVGDLPARLGYGD